MARERERAAYINLVSASDVASRDFIYIYTHSYTHICVCMYPAVSQMDVSVGKKGK